MGVFTFGDAPACRPLRPLPRSVPVARKTFEPYVAGRGFVQHVFPRRTTRAPQCDPRDAAPQNAKNPARGFAAAGFLEKEGGRTLLERVELVAGPIGPGLSRSSVPQGARGALPKGEVVGTGSLLRDVRGVISPAAKRFRGYPQTRTRW